MLRSKIIILYNILILNLVKSEGVPIIPFVANNYPSCCDSVDRVKSSLQGYSPCSTTVPSTIDNNNNGLDGMPGSLPCAPVTSTTPQMGQMMPQMPQFQAPTTPQMPQYESVPQQQMVPQYEAPTTPQMPQYESVPQQQILPQRMVPSYIQGPSVVGERCQTPGGQEGIVSYCPDYATNLFSGPTNTFACISQLMSVAQKLAICPNNKFDKFDNIPSLANPQACLTPDNKAGIRVRQYNHDGSIGTCQPIKDSGEEYAERIKRILDEEDERCRQQGQQQGQCQSHDDHPIFSRGGINGISGGVSKNGLDCQNQQTFPTLNREGGMLGSLCDSQILNSKCFKDALHQKENVLIIGGTQQPVTEKFVFTDCTGGAPVKIQRKDDE